MRRTVSNESGLTLIELCLVLLILGLIVAAASPRLYRSYRGLKLLSAAESIADELNLTQGRCAASGQEWRFRIWQDGHGYDVQRQAGDEPAIPPRPAGGRLRNWRTVVHRSLPDGITLAPPAARLQWKPGGFLVHERLSISGSDGKTYEIDLEGMSFTVHPANTTAP